MKPHQHRFTEFALSRQMLKFGGLILKSGYKSPYFLNAGLFDTGHGLALLGCLYAEALVDFGIGPDLLFDPTYRGVPVATTAAMVLTKHHDLDLLYRFNHRKTKDHGEGSNPIDDALQGRTILVSDVIITGTTIRELMEIIRTNDATLAGVLISLNRQERGRGGISAIQGVERDRNYEVVSITTLGGLTAYLGEKSEMAEHLAAVKVYREEFSVQRNLPDEKSSGVVLLQLCSNQRPAGVKIIRRAVLKLATDKA